MSSHVPGPRLPLAVQTALSAPWLGDRFLLRCTRRYGRTFRLNLYWLGPLVVTSDLELIRELFVTRKDGEPLAGLVPRGSFSRMLGDNPLVRTDGEEHKRYRRQAAGLLRSLAGPDGAAHSRLAGDVREAFKQMPVGGRGALWDMLEPLLFESMLRDALGVSDARRRARLRAAFSRYYSLGHHPILFDPGCTRGPHAAACGDGSTMPSARSAR